MEMYLGRHPFWPSFLSDGGVMLILLFLSLVFTVVCGYRSMKDISPELKVVDISIQGDEYARLGAVGIFRNIDGRGNDRVFVSYGLTGDRREHVYDGSRFVRFQTRNDLAFDGDSTLVAELTVRTSEDHSVVESRHNLALGAAADGFAVVDSMSRRYYRQFVICRRGREREMEFKETFDGRSLVAEGRNPYVYLNFRLDGDYEYDPGEAYIIFGYSRDEVGADRTDCPVNVLSVFPEPTYVSPSSIIYRGEDLTKVINNNGFTFLGEDLGIKQRSDRGNFLWTVLFGTAIAVTIDIVVNLILKWKGILPRRRRS